MADRPLCFVLMPFGLKRDAATGRELDFDSIYAEAIHPAIEAAGMEPLRADEERTGGIIHRAMFERLLLCDFAVADLTTANANVFYELGVRHAARPATTLAIFASHQMPPFDVNFLRALPYELGEGPAIGSGEAELLRAALSRRLLELRELAREEGTADSPIFQLLEDYGAPDVARLRADAFRDRARYSADLRSSLARARDAGSEEDLARVEEELGSLDGVEAGVLVDLLLSYRAVGGWDRMIRLAERLPAELRRSALIRQQLAFALNRAGERNRAIDTLNELIDDRGGSSESFGLLGRVYKDLWKEALQGGSGARAAGCLNRAIDAYTRGFEADPRDAYPGINLLTLLEIRGDEESLQTRAALQPVVAFAVSQRLKHARPDFWDHATQLELAVLRGDAEASARHLADALARVRESWEPLSTADNLVLILNARRARGMDQPWLESVIHELRGGQLGTGSTGSSSRV